MSRQKKQRAQIFVTVIVGVIFSFALALWVHREKGQAAELKFQNLSQARIESIEKTLFKNLDVLAPFQPFYNASVYVDRLEFRTYAASFLKKNPTFQTLIWVPRVVFDEREEYETLAKQKGLSDFKFNQRNFEGDFVRVGDQEEYLPVYYEEPYKNALFPLGFDFSSDKSMIDFLKKVRKSGEVGLIAWRDPINQDKEKEIFLFAIQPIYRKTVSLSSSKDRWEKLEGYVLGCIEIKSLIEMTLTLFKEEGVNIGFYDLNAPLEEQLLYFHPSRLSFLGPVVESDGSGRTWRVLNEIDMGGQRWKVVCTSFKPGWFSAFYLDSLFVFFIGLFFTCIIAVFLWLFLKRHSEKEELMAQLSKNNKQLEDEIETRKKAEKSLLKEKDFSERIISSSVDGIFSLDLFLNVTLWNPGMELITGFSKEEMFSKNVLEILPFLKEIGEDKNLKKAVAGKIVMSKERPYEIQRTKRKGLFEAIYSPIRGERGETVGCLGLMRDVTERNKMEQQILRSQKMDSLGQLAGGVAHDFNNLLTAILGYSDILLDSNLEDEDAIKYVTEIKKTGERAGALTRQLLAFSRKQIVETKHLNVTSLVYGIKQMLRELINEQIQLEFSLANDLKYLKGDRGQIEQIFLNLVVNARDAMPNGGKIKIETCNKELSEDSLERPDSLEPGSYVFLSISDTGEGIPPEIKEKIFDPFFTTKDPGKGTGMGLSIVYSVIKQSGGDIVVESEPGKGTTFKFYFPEEKDLFKEEEVFEDQVESIEGKSKTILLVDDEDSVRVVVGTVLRKKGFVVLEAFDGDQAFEVIQSHEPEIELLITDIGLPGKDGITLANQVKAISPSTKILFISGHLDKCVDQRGLKKTDFILAKPFASDVLLQKVYELLFQKKAA